MGGLCAVVPVPRITRALPSGLRGTGLIPELRKENNMKAVIEAIAVTAPLAALVTSYVENKLDYNLFDLLKDKVQAVIGFVISKL
jgi:hypothetical protein